MSKEKKRAFEVLILRHEEKLNEHGVLLEVDTQIIVQPRIVLSKDEKEAQFIAHRLVPEEFAAKTEELEVRIRPF